MLDGTNVPKERRCMRFCVTLFRMAGVWPLWKNRDCPDERLYLVYAALMYVVLIIHMSILTVGLFLYLRTWESLSEAVEDVIVFNTGLLVVVKVHIILRNQNALQDLIDDINNNLNVLELRDEEDRSIIRDCVKYENTLTISYVLSGYCIIIMYTISSIARILSSTETVKYTFPLKYPFYLEGFPVYHIVYLQQILSMFVNGHTGTAFDAFFLCLVHYIAGHFEILKRRISKEGGIITRNFVEYHNKVIGLIQKVESIFTFYLMFEIMVNSSLICLGLVQITQTEKIKLIHYTKCFIYVIIKLCQMFLYCHGGQAIIQKSFAISRKTYFGSWHETRSDQSGVNFRFVMMRSQKPVMIKGGNFYVLSSPTYTSVIHSAYTFFMVIKSLQ